MKKNLRVGVDIGGTFTDMILAGEGGLGGETGQLDRAIRHTQDVVRSQAEVVQAATRGSVESQRDLAGQAAHFFGSHADAAGEGGQGLGAVEALLDEKAVIELAANIQDPHQARIVDTGGAAGGIENGRGGRRRERHDDERDELIGLVVLSAPHLRLALRRERADRDIALIANHGSGVQARHNGSFTRRRPTRADPGVERPHLSSGMSERPGGGLSGAGGG